MAERLPAIYGKMTAAIEVSSTSMNVGRITARAMSHGLQSGHQSSMELALGLAGDRRFSSHHVTPLTPASVRAASRLFYAPRNTVLPGSRSYKLNAAAKAAGKEF